MSLCLMSSNFYIRQKKLPYSLKDALVYVLFLEVILKLRGVTECHLLRWLTWGVWEVGAAEGLELLADVGEELSVRGEGACVGHFN